MPLRSRQTVYKPLFLPAYEECYNKVH
jgi:hypothetical protein